MNSLPTIKLYKIDYEFIIKNYLDKSLWKKIWNLFIFKNNIFTLQLASIDTKEEKIYFEINFNKLNNQWTFSIYESRSFHAFISKYPLLWLKENSCSITCLKSPS